VVYLLQQKSPIPVATSEAVLQGLVAGAVGGVIVTLAQSLFMSAMGPMILERMRSSMNDSQMPPEARQFMERIFSGSGFTLMMVFITVPLYAVFSMAGSFLGLAFFRKKVPPQAPPQA